MQTGARQYAARSASELTVHLGDITLDAVSDSSQLEAARVICEPWLISFRFLPGNHDISLAATWYDITSWKLTDDSRCKSCGTPCAGLFDGACGAGVDAGGLCL